MSGGMAANRHNIMAMAPAGPVALQFIRSRAYIAGIMGPVGSGKTTACIAKCVQAAIWQHPAPDGKRYCKVAVIRDTYPNLDATVIESWHNWYPPTIGHWVGDAPRTHDLTIEVAGLGQVVLQMIFVAIGDKRVEDVLRGLEVTMIWINEADRVSKEVLKYARGRVGRYPNAMLGGCAWCGIIMDFNAPDPDNWVYELFIDGNNDGGEAGEQVQLFRQPGGREPNAENLANLPKGYYARQLIGATPDYVRRMIDNQFGYSRDGQPVYPEFQDHLHVAAAPLEPIKGLQLLIGLDAGMTPAAVIGQRLPSGQLRVTDELAVFPTDGAPLASMGPVRFGKALHELLTLRYGAWRRGGWGDEADILVWADPASQYGADKLGGEKSWMDIVSAEIGVRIRPAHTNNLILRLEAVRAPLVRLIEGGQPGLIISPTAKVLRRGFNAGYHFRRVLANGNSGRFNDEPNKNEFSHAHDALQYLALGCGEGRRVMGQETSRMAVVAAADDYSEFGD